MQFIGYKPVLLVNIYKLMCDFREACNFRFFAGENQ